MSGFARLVCLVGLAVGAAPLSLRPAFAQTPACCHSCQQPVTRCGCQANPVRRVVKERDVVSTEYRREPVTETVRLEEERVEVDRRPVDRPAGEDVFRDRTIEAEEFREEAVVQKEARVVEEVGLRRSHDSHEETISDTVRRTEVEVEDDRTGLGSLRGRDDRVTEEEAELDEDDEDLSDRRPTGL